jgi:hypothetical protein
MRERRFWPFERLYNGAEERSEPIMNSEVATILQRILAAEGSSSPRSPAATT